MKRRIFLDEETQLAVAMNVQGASVGEFTEEIPCPSCSGTGISKLFGDDWCGACGGCGAAWKLRDGVRLSLLAVQS